MGDRVYQGFRLATDSFAEALRIVEAFRPWVIEQSEKRLDSYLAYVMEEDGGNFIAAFDQWQDRRRVMRSQQLPMPAVDTDFTVVLVPYEGYLFGRVYTVQPEWRAAWYEHPGVEEFSHWDNMDKPDDVSEEDWTARGKAWATLSDCPMSMQGFSIELVSPEGPMPKAWRRPK